MINHIFLNKEAVKKVCADKELAKQMHVSTSTVSLWKTDGLSANSVEKVLDIVNGLNQIQGKPVLDYDNPELYKIASKFVTGTEVDLMDKYFKVVGVEGYDDTTITSVLVQNKAEKDPDLKLLKIYKNGVVEWFQLEKGVVITRDDDFHCMYKIHTDNGERFIHLSTMVCWAFGVLNQDNKLMKVHYIRNARLICNPDSLINIEICTIPQYKRYRALEKKLLDACKKYES
jgi:hypothetical protein